MIKLRFQLIIRIIKTLVYCTLFAVGCYFIYEGQVIQRYTLGRTNFAEFEEELEEFPTILFFIDDGDKTALTNMEQISSSFTALKQISAQVTMVPF